MTHTAIDLEALAKTILDRMRGGPILAVGPERSEAILIEELRKLVDRIERIDR